MCNNDIREEVRRLKKELGLSNKQLVRMIKEKNSYPLTEGEIASYMKGTNLSPKSNRVMIDALKILIVEHEKIDQLLTQARNL